MENIKRFYQKLSWIEDKIYNLCKILGAIAMGVAFIAIAVQVLYRYVLSRFMNLPLSFTEELARYCLFWIIYLLLPLTIKEGLEASNTFLPSKLKGMAKTILYLIVRGICLVVAVLAFLNSFTVMQTNWLFKSPVMQLPGFFMYGPVVIGMGMVLFRYFVELLGFVCGEVKPFGNIGQGGVE